jgi:hypothetical protein
MDEDFTCKETAVEQYNTISSFVLGTPQFLNKK